MISKRVIFIVIMVQSAAKYGQQHQSTHNPTKEFPQGHSGFLIVFFKVGYMHKNKRQEGKKGDYGYHKNWYSNHYWDCRRVFFAPFRLRIEHGLLKPLSELAASRFGFSLKPQGHVYQLLCLLRKSVFS